MGLFSSTLRRKGNFYLALDIGTEVVKALICDCEGTKGRVIGVGKKQQSLGDMQSGTVMDIASVIANCQDAINDARKISNVNPDKMIIGIAGELVKGATLTMSYTRREPDVKIDLSELKNIVHKIQWKAFDQVRAQLAHETGYNEIDVKLVNAAIADVTIDGYRVSNPIGFQGKDVVISIFNAFAPLVHYGALQTIAAELGMELLAIAAEPYAMARCLGEQENANLNAIFIDVGGGTTDIAIVRNGRVEGTKMFTIGGRTFTKRLAQSLNVSFTDAERIKLAYSTDKLEKHSSKLVRDAMKSDADVWLTGIILTLNEFEGLDMLPSRIYLCGGGSKLPEIREVLEEREWVKTLPFVRKPTVNFMSPKMVPSMSDETKLLSGPEDITPLALSNIALEFIGEEYILSKLLKKVVRLMQI